MMYCSETGGQEVGNMPPLKSQLIEHGCYQGLPVAGQAKDNTQNSPLMGSLREKGGQHPTLEVYYIHIS